MGKDVQKLPLLQVAENSWGSAVGTSFYIEWYTVQYRQFIAVLKIKTFRTLS